MVLAVEVATQLVFASGFFVVYHSCILEIYGRCYLFLLRWVDVNLHLACDLQADLDKALPALDEAVTSLKSLSKNDVVEVKSMSNPPAGVKMVMDACCIMFDLKGKKIPDPNGGPGAPKITDYWDDAKKLLNDPSKYLNSLMTYDKDNIPPVCSPGTAGVWQVH